MKKIILMLLVITSLAQASQTGPAKRPSMDGIDITLRSQVDTTAMSPEVAELFRAVSANNTAAVQAALEKFNSATLKDAKVKFHFEVVGIVEALAPTVPEIPVPFVAHTLLCYLLNGGISEEIITMLLRTENNPKEYEDVAQYEQMGAGIPGVVINSEILGRINALQNILRNMAAPQTTTPAVETQPAANAPQVPTGVTSAAPIATQTATSAPQVPFGFTQPAQPVPGVPQMPPAPQ